jgi:hypothetical protein
MYKKKLLGLIGLTGVAAAVFFTTSVNKNTSDISLKSLVSVNTANAECTNNGVYTGGKCLTLSQICVGDPGNTQCSF